MAGLRRFSVLIIIAIVMCAGCARDGSAEFSAEDAERIISRIRADSMLDEKDYRNMLSQLEGMLEIVCVKAESIIDSGYRQDEVRTRLGMDSVYRRISVQGTVMDSAFVKYLNSPYSNPALRKEYRIVLSRYADRAAQAGLK